MSKQLLITRMSCLLDRGSGTVSDTSYFIKRSHDKLIVDFQTYVERHVHLLGQAHIERTQALNDRGTDLIVKQHEHKIGFQIKSHYDVSQSKFAESVKRQGSSASRVNRGSQTRELVY